MNSERMLTRDDAFELLSYLITSARGLLDEPKDYGPRRLLTAAGKLALFIAPHADDATRPFLEDFSSQVEALFPLPSHEATVDALDTLCAAVARELVRQSKLDQIGCAVIRSGDGTARF